MYKVHVKQCETTAKCTCRQFFCAHHTGDGNSGIDQSGQFEVSIETVPSLDAKTNSSLQSASIDIIKCVVFEWKNDGIGMYWIQFTILTYTNHIIHIYLFQPCFSNEHQHVSAMAHQGRATLARLWAMTWHGEHATGGAKRLSKWSTQWRIETLDRDSYHHLPSKHGEISNRTEQRKIENHQGGNCPCHVWLLEGRTHASGEPTSQCSYKSSKTMDKLAQHANANFIMTFC